MAQLPVTIVSAVHKLILSLASLVSKDMFTFPQLLNQNQNGEHQLSIVDVLEPPEVMDKILRLVYPGVDHPKITELLIMSALLSATDKYNLTSMTRVLRDALKDFLAKVSFGVYIIAYRFGLREVAREAAMVSTMQNILQQDHDEAISNTYLLRFFRFVQVRGREGLLKIKDSLGRDYLAGCVCKHRDNSQTFDYRLAREVGDAFVLSPHVQLKDLLTVLDKVPGPPSCEPSSHPAEFYRD